jgi:predicted RNase H-like nuclease
MFETAHQIVARQYDALLLERNQLRAEVARLRSEVEYLKDSIRGDAAMEENARLLQRAEAAEERCAVEAENVIACENYITELINVDAENARLREDNAALVKQWNDLDKRNEQKHREWMR